MIIRRSTVQISLDVLRIGTKHMNKKTLVMVALSLSVCAAIYGSEPLAASWTATGSMQRPRAFFAAAELPNGNILVAGGFDQGVTFADSEIYDWHTGLWTVTASMIKARSAPVAVQLENGRVMVMAAWTEMVRFSTPPKSMIPEPIRGRS